MRALSRAAARVTPTAQAPRIATQAVARVTAESRAHRAHALPNAQPQKHRFSLNTRINQAAILPHLYFSYPEHLPHYAGVEANPAEHMQGFGTKLIDWLSDANRSYEDRTREGIYYPFDLKARYYPHHDNNEVATIAAVAHPAAFDLTQDWRHIHFHAHDHVAPADALNAFFVGPTTADCGSVLQACFYKAIEDHLGTVQFNQVFTQSLTPFTISQYMFGPNTHTITAHNNPLGFLFNERTADFTESDLRVGDMVYIRGHKHYPAKHPQGTASGWNVICTGIDGNGDALYLGFGPGKFQKPLTYKQIKQILVDAYNMPQTAFEYTVNQKIAALELNEMNLISVARASIGLNLGTDMSDDIEGLQFLRRFDLTKLNQFAADVTQRDETPCSSHSSYHFFAQKKDLPQYYGYDHPENRITRGQG